GIDFGVSALCASSRAIKAPGTRNVMMRPHGRGTRGVYFILVGLAAERDLPFLRDRADALVGADLQLLGGDDLLRWAQPPEHFRRAAGITQALDQADLRQRAVVDMDADRDLLRETVADDEQVRLAAPSVDRGAGDDR